MKPLAFPTSIVMTSGIVTVSTPSGVMESVIGTDQAERKRKDTGRGGTGRKRRDVTSLLAGNSATHNTALSLTNCLLNPSK